VGAFEIALRNNIAVYGALFIVIARRENLELATCDEKQAKTARKEGLRAMLLS
jgi:predicted nucleic acid-binding protein